MRFNRNMFMSSILCKISCYIYLNIIYREKKEFRNKREKKMGKQRIREIEQKGTKNSIDI